MDKTKFARETGSEEVNLGNFIDDDDDDEEDENKEPPELEISASPLRMVNSKMIQSAKVSENYCSPQPTTSFTTNGRSLIYNGHLYLINLNILSIYRIDFVAVYSSPLTSRKRHCDMDSSFEAIDADEDQDDEFDNDESKLIFNQDNSKILMLMLLVLCGVNKKSIETNDSSNMLSKLLNRKKAPAKKRKKITSATNGNYELNITNKYEISYCRFIMY